MDDMLAIHMHTHKHIYTYIYTYILTCIYRRWGTLVDDLLANDSDLNIVWWGTDSEHEPPLFYIAANHEVCTYIHTHTHIQTDRHTHTHTHTHMQIVVLHCG